MVVMKQQLMNLRTLGSVFLIAIAGLASKAHAAPITYEFVPTSIANGGTFTAEITFDTDDFGMGWISDAPSAFFASLSGNSSVTVPDRTWELDEITSLQYMLSNAGVLTINYLTVSDNDLSIPPGNPNGWYLNGGPTGFSAPTTIGGSWQEKVVTSNVPDAGPGVILPAALTLAMVFVRNRRRASRKTAA